jgi:hypothetical protein
LAEPSSYDDDELLHHVGGAPCNPLHATLLVVVRTLMRLHLVAHGLSLTIGLLPVLVLRQVVILTSRSAVILQVVSMSTVTTSLHRLGDLAVVCLLSNYSRRKRRREEKG